MKVNLPVHEVCATPSMNEKRNQLIAVIAPAEFHPPCCEKCGFNLVSRAFFIRGSTSLIEFVFFILVRQEQKILARKGKLLACDQKCKSFIG